MHVLPAITMDFSAISRALNLVFSTSAVAADLAYAPPEPIKPAMVPQVSHAIPALEKMLADAVAAEVGIAENFQCEEQLYHWRRERRCPRDAAVRALFAIGRVPEDNRMLTAMVAESMHAAIICGTHTLPHRFTMAQWQGAVAAAGGLAVADPVIRAARQQWRNQENDPDDAADACESELKDVIRQLSGRLV